MVISYAQPLADKIAYSIREIMQSGWFCRVFRTRIAKRKLDDFVTTAGGGVRSVSIEGGVTGLGADVIIVDDPAQIKDCDNARQLERVNSMFDSEIRTRLNHPKTGAIIIVAHRLAEDDLPGHVLREGGWKELRLPFTAPRSRTYKMPGGFVWRRNKGELLRPDAFTRRDIERLRLAKRPGFETLQQQNPSNRDRLRIKVEHFGVFTPKSIPRDEPVVLSVDPGQKGGPANSFSVVQAWMSQDGQYFLLDQWREQARYVDLRTAVFSFIRKYRPSAVLVEATGQGPALTSQIRPQRGVQIESITPHDDKVSRLLFHRKAIRSGRVLLPKNADWLDQFLDEVVLFPYAPFDDQVDSMTQALDWIVAHPDMRKRPPRACIAGLRSDGSHLPSQARSTPAIEFPGAVMVRGLKFRR
jgi:predicted phage terminase large subunit-like protein